MPKRPVFLNLLRIHLPLTGWVSILHRLSGGLLFLAVPVAVWGMSQSLSDEAGFRRVADWFGHPLGKLLLLILIWAFAHHLFAGLRHLALDAHWGIDLRHARRSSIAVLLAGGLVTLLFAGIVFT